LLDFGHFENRSSGTGGLWDWIGAQNQTKRSSDYGNFIAIGCENYQEMAKTMLNSRWFSQRFRLVWAKLMAK
jgi:hypothetical protein